MSDHEHTHDDNKPQRRKRVAEFLTGLMGRKNKTETERTREPLRHSFTVKVGNETQVADLEIAPRSLQIEEELLHPEPGLVTIVTRPSEKGEPTSNVFRVEAGQDGQVNWTCDAVKGGQARRLEHPMGSLTMAQDSDAKYLGQFAPVTLPKGTIVLATRRAEISEIQAVVEGAQADAETLALQEQYQHVITIAMGVSLDAEQIGTPADRIAEIDARLPQLEERKKEITALVGRGELSQIRGEDEYDLIDGDMQRLRAERARLTGE